MRYWLSRRFQRLRQQLTGSRLLVLLSMPLALAVLLPAWWLACRFYERGLLLQHRAHVASDLSPTSYALTEAFRERFAVLVELKTLSEFGGLLDTPRADVTALSAEVLSNMKGIRGVWIAPGGVIQHVYPLAGNEALLGRNLLEDERTGVRRDVERAVVSKRITMTDPADFGHANTDWAAWQAVHRNGQFWGLVGMRLDPGEVLHSAGLDVPRGWMQLAVRDDAGRMVYGPEALFEADPVIQTVELPDGEWELAAAPTGGWAASVGEQLRVLEIGGLVIALMLASFIFLVATRNERLEQAVRERTREISSINRALEEDIAKRKEAEADRERLLAELERRVNERTHQLKTLYDVTAVASASLDLREILDRSLEAIVAAVDVRVGVIHLYDEGAGALRVAASRDFPDGTCYPPGLLEEGEWIPSHCWICWSKEPLLVDNTAADPRTELAFSRLGAQAHLGVPLRAKGQTVGVICLFRGLDRPFSQEEVSLLTAIADQLGTAIENARLFATIQDKATLEERQRLASELHDSVTQLIYSEMLLAEATRQMVANGQLAAAGEYLGMLGETSQQALKEMRLLLYELRPTGVSQAGLVAALQRRLDAVEKRAGLGVQLVVHGTPDLPPPMEEGLYRIAQEALNNTLKHSAATSVAIELRVDSHLVEMEVSDNGKGFDPRGVADSGGLGLTTMRERAERMGGSLEIDSSGRAGSTVRVRVPLADDPTARGNGREARDLALVAL